MNSRINPKRSIVNVPIKIVIVLLIAINKFIDSFLKKKFTQIITPSIKQNTEIITVVKLIRRKSLLLCNNNASNAKEYLLKYLNFDIPFALFILV